MTDLSEMFIEGQTQLINPRLVLTLNTEAYSPIPIHSREFIQTNNK